MRELRIDSYADNASGISVNYTENPSGTVAGMPPSGLGVNYASWDDFLAAMTAAEQAMSSETLMLIALARQYKSNGNRATMANAVNDFVTLDFAGTGQPVKVTAAA